MKLLLRTLYSLLFAASAIAADRPNIIVLLSDDQGYGDLQAHGNPILKTPNLDQLHSESIRFDNFHVAPVCTPTRGELMTGLTALRNKASMVPAGRNLMRRDIPTMADVFKANGYRTGLFGKWHLGDSYPHRPMDRGFEKVVWHKGWGLSSEIEYDNSYYYTRYLDHLDVKFSDRYCANLWFDKAIEWMEEKADADEPFFTYLALNTPHGPFHSRMEGYNLYKDKVENDLMANFFGMIHNIDQNYARLNKWLEYKGIKENTILIYMTDNGTSRGDLVYNAGMRGKKSSNYDGGHRAICFIRWPNGNFGTPRSDDYASHVTDILPTLVDLLDFKVPGNASFDGRSLKPILRNENHGLSDRMFVVQYGGKIFRPSKYFSCVVWDQWRLVGADELYDLRVDPGQETNIAAKFPDIHGKMKAYYDAYWAEIEPTIEVVETIIVGGESEQAAEFTGNNWLELDCDNQRQIAQAVGPPRGGVWHIEAAKSGAYRVEISRWPFHMNRDLTIEGPPATIGGTAIITGVALPIAMGSLSLDEAAPAMSNAKPGDTTIDFVIRIEKGRHTLQGWFNDKSGQDLRGAFFGRVTAL